MEGKHHLSYVVEGLMSYYGSKHHILRIVFTFKSLSILNCPCYPEVKVFESVFKFRIVELLCSSLCNLRVRLTGENVKSQTKVSNNNH